MYEFKNKQYQIEREEFNKQFADAIKIIGIVTAIIIIIIIIIIKVINMKLRETRRTKINV